MDAAQDRWRRFNGHELVADVLAGTKCRDGIPITDNKNDENKTTDERVAASSPFTTPSTTFANCSNNNPLLRYAYPGAIGLKTGETEAAGLCLVGAAQRHGVRLGVVLLHSPELGHQAEALLDAGFRQVYGQAPVPAPPVPKGR